MRCDDGLWDGGPVAAPQYLGVVLYDAMDLVIMSIVSMVVTLR